MKNITEKIVYLKNDFSKNLVNLKQSNFSHVKKIYIKNHLEKFINEIKSTKDLNRKKILGTEIHNFEKYLKHEFLRYKKNIDKSEHEQDVFSVDGSIIKKQVEYGMFHPLQKFKELIENVCTKIGFISIEGPDIELEKYNFTKLNIPKYHPARDMQDTFYVHKKDKLLRSHTSSVQIRILEKYNPPLQCISCGTVYRVDDIDAQHTPMFYQSLVNLIFSLFLYNLV